MAKRIVLLTPAEQFGDLAALVHRRDPAAGVAHAPDLATLEAAAAQLGPGDRVLSFATPVIVPDILLQALPGPAYNFHGGPPAYPGLFPAVFAIYEGARAFGATAHVMTAEVDQGPIVGTATVDMPQGIDRMNLETLSRDVLLGLFERLLTPLIETDGPLQPVDVAWGTPVRRKSDFEALCTLPPDIGKEEFELRLRAVGEGPFHALRIPLHGRWFRLESQAGAGPVYRGGIKVT